MAAKSNIVLCVHHRVGLCEWPIMGSLDLKDPRSSTLQSLLKWAKETGQEGIESSISLLYPTQFKDSGLTQMECAEVIKRECLIHGLQLLGSLQFVTDGNPPPRKECCSIDANDAGWLQKLREMASIDKAAGAEQITFQVWLADKQLNTGGMYREDQEQLDLVAERLKAIEQACWSMGLNAYFETHVDRVSEDVVAFQNILIDKAKLRKEGNNQQKVEVNGDLSHQVQRNIIKGDALESILSRVNHMHVRLARVHGDLSADVDDIKKDFVQQGRFPSASKATWDMHRRAILASNGLSSRVICGESGPIHLVKDTLTVEAKLMPLLKGLAQVADGMVWCTSKLDDSYNPFE